MTTESRLNDRLARVAAARAAKARAVAWPDAERRRLMRAKVAVGAVIREALLRVGADPLTCEALRLAEEAEAELAAFPDTPALQRADDRLLADTGDDAAAGAFDAKMTGLIERYRNGLTLDFPTASMACLLAWSLAGIPSPAPRERVAEGRVRAERSEVSDGERRRAPPSPSHRSAIGPSLSRDAGEG